MNDKKTHTEWAVKHSQGIATGGSSRALTEAQARALYEDFQRREDRIRPSMRGQNRILRREVTEWEEVDE